MEDKHFFNRIVELGFLVEPRNKFVMLDGPAGYGKSYLLAQLEQIYKTDKRYQGKWIVLSVHLNGSKIDDQSEWLIETISQQLSFKMKADLNRRDIALLEIANYIKRQGKSLLFLLDGLERSSDNELIWLRYRLPYQLRSVLGIDVRLIISGRHIIRRIRALSNISGQVRQQERLLSFEPCLLSPFDKGVIGSILDWYAETVDTAKPKVELIDSWTEEICFLSGGHPEAIIALVEDLVIETNWGWTLQDGQFIPELIRQELFQKSLKTIAGSVIERTLVDVQGSMLGGPGSLPVTREVFQDLETVMLLRRFETSLLVQLKRIGLISSEPLLLQGLLMRKGWSSGVDPKTGWQENDGIPRITTLHRRYEARTRTRCLELHHKLHMVYHNRAIGRDANGDPLPRTDLWLNATNILLSIFESLYQYLSGIEEFPQSQDQSKELQSHLTDLMINYLIILKPYCDDDNSALQRLWGMLNEPDQDELRFLARWLLGIEIWSQIYDALQTSLTQINSWEFAKNPDNDSRIVQEGEYIMQKRNLLDWLVDALDILRHTTQNVLIERWEKRNLGKAVTPPAFDDKPRSHEELRSLLPKEDQILTKLKGYQKPNGVAVVVSAQHIKNLVEQMETAQKTVDRYDKELSTPMSRSEKIAIEHEKDGFQAKIDQAAEELADILAYLYS